MKASYTTLLFGLMLLLVGCRHHPDEARRLAQSSYRDTGSWDVEDMREVGVAAVYIMNEATNGTSKVLTNIQCDGSEKPKVQAVADHKWPSTKPIVQIKFEGNSKVITQVWLADGDRATAPNPLALFKSFLAHDRVQISYPSPNGAKTKVLLNIDRSATTLQPVAAFCGLGGAPNPAKIRSIEIRGKLVAHLMTSDEVFAILRPSDEVGKMTTEPDNQTPGSLTVVHTYLVSGKQFSISFRRIPSDGPYRVDQMWWVTND